MTLSYCVSHLAVGVPWDEASPSVPFQCKIRASGRKIRLRTHTKIWTACSMWRAQVRNQDSNLWWTFRRGQERISHPSQLSITDQQPHYLKMAQMNQQSSHRKVSLTSILRPRIIAAKRQNIYAIRIKVFSLRPMMNLTTFRRHQTG